MKIIISICCILFTLLPFKFSKKLVAYQPIQIINRDSLPPGDFWFSRDNIKKVMGEYEKWYHFKTVYNTIPSGEFTAGISKNESLRSVLNMLEEKFHVRIQIRGNIVIVNPWPERGNK